MTPKGMELYPVVMAIVRWGDSYMADKKGPPLYHRIRSAQSADQCRIRRQPGSAVDTHEVINGMTGINAPANPGAIGVVVLLRTGDALCRLPQADPARTSGSVAVTAGERIGS